MLVSDRIGACPSALMASGCARSLESSRRHLMPVMSYHSSRQAPRSAVIAAAVALQGVTVEAPGEMRRDGSDLVFPLFLGLVERKDKGNRLDVLPIEGVLADGSCPMQHTWLNHRRRFHCIRFPTVGCFLQRRRIVSLRYRLR